MEKSHYCLLVAFREFYSGDDTGRGLVAGLESAIERRRCERMTDRVRVDVREAREDDREFLWNLKVAAMRPYVEVVYGWDEQVQHGFFDRGFRPERIRIVRLEGEDVGMFELEERAGGRFLARIEILPRFQDRGIGTAVMEGLMRDARAAAKPLRLQVLKINPARRLYERLGFVATGETETHVRMELQPPQPRASG